MLRKFWQRITASRARQALEATPHVERALREDIARVRAENRALLNSILGIAGIPPIVVSEAEAASEAAMLNTLPRVAAPFRSVPVPFTGTNLTLPSRANQGSQPRRQDAGATNTAPPRPEKPESQAPSRGRFSRQAARRLPATSSRPSAARAASQHNAPAPRHRSWQQINRMLEFESARKKPQET